MTEYKKKLMLVDGHALVYRAFHALPQLTNKQGFPTGAIFGFFSILFKALADIKPTHALVTFDLSGPTFRHAMTTDYKAKRKPTPDDLNTQLPKVKAILTALDIPIFEKPGFEADDLLGIICGKTPKNLLNIILTGDMDMIQLVNKNTAMYRLKTGISELVIYDEKKVVEQFGITPHQWVDYKALRGDPSDNIPGVPGVGEKTALELVKKYGSIEKLFEAVEKQPGEFKPALLKKLSEGKESAFLSYRLAHIDHKNHLEFDLDATIMGDYDQVKVIDIFNELEIKSLIPRLPKTSQPAPAALPPQIVNKRPNKLIKTEDEALIAAYLLDPGRRNYGSSDWDLLATQLEAKHLVSIFTDIELPLKAVLAQMSETGIELDLRWLQALSDKLNKRIIALTKQIHTEAGGEFNIASPIQLREVLFEKLAIATQNLKKTGKTKALSTAAEQLEKLRGLHPIIDLIFEFRELTKLKSTYVDALPLLVGKDGRVHTTYSQTIAATGRLSSLNPNLQNIPIRTELGQGVRKAFVASAGNLLASLDYSQIELRIAASLSGDPEMIRIFNEGEDFHAATAARIFGLKESEVTPSQRRDAKTINFSVLYGVSAFGLSERSDMGRAEAGEFIKKYFNVFSQLKKYIDQSIEQAHKTGMAVNPLGRIRFFPEINTSNFGIRSAAERAAVNMPIQSLAADIIKMSMIRIDEFLRNSSITNLISPSGGDVAEGDREGRSTSPSPVQPLKIGAGHPPPLGEGQSEKSLDCKMLLSVHDELVFEIKKDKVEGCVPKIRKIMESVYQLKVPLVVDAKVGQNWKEMETWNQE